MSIHVACAMPSSPPPRELASRPVMMSPLPPSLSAIHPMKGCDICPTNRAATSTPAIVSGRWRDSRMAGRIPGR